MQSSTTSTSTATAKRTPPDAALGRLLDRAAGALSHSHPELATELASRAAREHEPADPFDSLTGDEQVDRFRTFGYLVLRGYFDPPLVERLRAEAMATIRAVHGDRYHQHRPMSGMPGRYTCLLGPWHPAPSGSSTAGASCGWPSAWWAAECCRRRATPGASCTSTTPPGTATRASASGG